MCNNTIGSFYCSCGPGFLLTNTFNCSGSFNNVRTFIMYLLIYLVCVLTIMDRPGGTRGAWQAMAWPIFCISFNVDFVQ